MEKRLVENEEIRSSDPEFKDQMQNENDSLINNNIPKKLKKTFLITTALLFIGILLFGYGIIEIIDLDYDDDKLSGITFILIGFLVLIPGVYYTFRFCQAKFTKDSNMRNSLYESIPQL